MRRNLTLLGMVVAFVFAVSFTACSNTEKKEAKTEAKTEVKTEVKTTEQDSTVAVQDSTKAEEKMDSTKAE